MALRRKVGPSYTTTQLGSQEWLRRLGLGRAWEGRGSEVAPRCPLSDSLTQYKQPSQLQTVLRCRYYTYCIITVGGRDVLVISPTLLHFTTQPCTGHQTPGWRRTAPGLPAVSSPPAAVWPPLPSRPLSDSLCLQSERNMSSAIEPANTAVLTRSQQVHLPLRIFGELLRVVAMDV